MDYSPRIYWFAAKRYLEYSLYYQYFQLVPMSNFILSLINITVSWYCLFKSYSYFLKLTFTENLKKSVYFECNNDLCYHFQFLKVFKQFFLILKYSYTVYVLMAFRDFSKRKLSFTGFLNNVWNLPILKPFSLFIHFLRIRINSISWKMLSFLGPSIQFSFLNLPRFTLHIVINSFFSELYNKLKKNLSRFHCYFYITQRNEW